MVACPTRATNDVSGTGRGTSDNNGNINGQASFIDNLAAVTVLFVGAGAPTADGIVLSGTGNILSKTISGSGTWTAS